ncbi:MAG: hypothetical protein RR348_01255 [Clostridia bacterium]
MSMPIITPGTVTRPQAISDLIESVALEETGLSHIINAEGEKIQAFVKMAGVTAEELLAVNASVQETIKAITNLEMILESKLNLFSKSLNA